MHGGASSIWFGGCSVDELKTTWFNTSPVNDAIRRSVAMTVYVDEYPNVKRSVFWSKVQVKAANAPPLNARIFD